MVWKDYSYSLNEINTNIFAEKGFYPQKISISGHSAIKYTTNQKGESIYAIQVNNDIVTVYICGYSDELKLVETILSLVFADSNNKIGGFDSQSYDSSSNEDNSTDNTDSESSDGSSGSTSNNNRNAEKSSNEEPLPPSDNYFSGSDSSSGSST